jgi:hypothetical protein
MTEPCVGCGAVVDVMDGPIHRYMTSAPCCWARYGELLGVLANQPALMATRQLCVDAYAVQHPGTATPQAIQSVALHLLNLHGYLVRGRPVGIPRMLGHKGAFHWLRPPSFATSRTVFDVPVTTDGAAISEAARAWAESVWTAWSPHHPQIVAWYARFTHA